MTPDTAITHLVVLNNHEITEHNRVFSSSMTTSSSNVELANGNKRRFIKNVKNLYTLSFTWLPSLQTQTIDGRRGRDYLYSLATMSSQFNLSIKLNPDDLFYDTVVYVDSYNETLLRRDISTQCAYYNVDISLKEK